MLLKHKNPTDWLSEAGEAVRSSLVLITGEIGVGKSYLADRLYDSTSVPWFDLDTCLSIVNTESGKRRHYIDVDAVEERLQTWGHTPILVGTCDNLAELVSRLAPQWALTLYIVTADCDSFRRIQNARYTETALSKTSQGSIKAEGHMWGTRALLTTIRLESRMAAQVWGHLVTVAYGMNAVGELPSAPALSGPDLFNWRYKAWQESLLDSADQICECMKSACVDLSVVTNVIPNNVSSIKGWHAVRGGVKI